MGFLIPLILQSLTLLVGVIAIAILALRLRQLVFLIHHCNTNNHGSYWVIMGNTFVPTHQSERLNPCPEC